MKRFFVLFVLLAGCAYSVPRGRPDYREVGLASWYGEPFHGRKTSSGEVYDMHDLTAAHRTLPFGTMLHVTDLKTGRSVEVRVNDRGPFVGGRILDLSYGAAAVLGAVQRGIVEVAIKVLRLGKDDQAQDFLVQVGSFSVLENAQRVKAYVKQYRKNVYIESVETNKGAFHRVRIGPFKSSDQAYGAIRSLPRHEEALGKLDMVVIRAH